MKTCFQSCSGLSSEGCGFLPHCPVSTRIWSYIVFSSENLLLKFQWTVVIVVWFLTTSSTIHCQIMMFNKESLFLKFQWTVHRGRSLPVLCSSPYRWPCAADVTICGWCDVKIGKLANLHMSAGKTWWYLDVAGEVHWSLHEILICIYRYMCVCSGMFEWMVQMFALLIFGFCHHMFKQISFSKRLIISV